MKLTPDELAAFDEVLARAGIENRTEGLRRLLQAVGGTFLPDVQLAAEMVRYWSSLNEVGRGQFVLKESSNAFTTPEVANALATRTAKGINTPELGD